MLYPENPKKNIYLAEDDEDDRLLFLEAMQELDAAAEVMAAEDGELLLNILSKAGKDLPEIIFLDINMPKKNGFDCLREIRAGAGWKNIKVVMLSTSSNPENIELAYSLGADCYVVKPATLMSLSMCWAMYWRKTWAGKEKTEKSCDCLKGL